MVEFDNMYNNLFSSSYKGDEHENSRLSGIIEGKINMLRADYTIVESGVTDTAQYQKQLLLAALQNASGTLIIEPNVLNVRDKPNIEGNIVFKADGGMVYRFNNQYTDDRHITWYEIEINEQRGWVSGLYTLIQGIEATVDTPQSFFYDLDYNTLAFTERKQYLESGQKAVVLKKLNDFIYTQYTNSQGITTKGWLNINSLMQ